MMTKTHAWSGAALWLTTATAGHLNPILTGVGTYIAWHAARFPDVDNPGSSPAQQINKLFPGLPNWLENHLGHRGATHWGVSAIASGTLFAALLAAISPQLAWIGAAITIGWLAHILGDCLTWQGAPLLAPINRRPLRPPYGYRFKTGGDFEHIVVSRFVKLWTIAATAAFVYTIFGSV